MFDSPTTTRRIAISAAVALALGLAAVSVFAGYSGSSWLRLIEGVAVFGLGAAIVGGAVVLVMIRLAGWRDPDARPPRRHLARRPARLPPGRPGSPSVAPC